jgi:hypothetical protein
MGNCLRKLVDTEESKMVTMIVDKIKTIEIKVIEPEPTVVRVDKGMETTEPFEFSTIYMEPVEEKPEN